MVNVYVIGAGMTKFGPQPDTGVHDLAFRAAWQAIETAGVDPARIDIAFAGHAYQGPCFGQKSLMKMGLTGIPIINVENACASGASAVMGVVHAIKAGEVESASPSAPRSSPRPAVASCRSWPTTSIRRWGG